MVSPDYAIVLLVKSALFSLSVTTTNTAAMIQPMRFWVIMMIVIMIVGGAMDLFT